MAQVSFRSFFAVSALVALTFTPMLFADNDAFAANDSVEEAQRLRGEQASKALLSGLQQKLLTAIASDGIVAAVSFCSEQALPLTESIAQKVEAGELGRVSARPRNPKNRPDAFDREALDFFDTNPDATHRLQQGHSEGMRRYYKPLRIKGLCLQCHGARAQMSPEVVQKIDELYPDDKAYGYELGELRGAVRVLLTEPPKD